METRAKTEFEGARDSLIKYCESCTKYSCEVKDSTYPLKVVFTPDPTLSMLDENIDEHGAIGALTIEVGLDTRVISTLKFEMDSQLLKKFIKSAEKLAFLHYHAFREAAGDIGEPTGMPDEIREKLHQALGMAQTD